MPDYAELLSRFHKLRPGRKADEWYAACPVQENHRNADSHPSLLLGIGDTGCLTATCQKGCQWSAIVAAIGSKPQEWFPPKDGKEKQVRRIGYNERTFDYFSEQGELIYQSVRREWFFADSRKKHVFHRKPKGDGWVSNLDDVKPTLYNLPAIQAKPSDSVCVVEGEPKVDLLTAWGVLSTCNSGGSKAWKRELSCHLAGRVIYVFPDNDDPGEEWAMDVLGSVFLYGARGVAVVRLPGLPEKGDVVDWSVSGGTKEQFVEIVGASIVWKPSFSF